MVILTVEGAQKHRNTNGGGKEGEIGGWEGEWDGEDALTYGVYMMLFVRFILMV